MEDKKPVYITAHGDKYHIDKNCLYISGKKIEQISLSDAEKRKKPPCKGCSLDNNNNNMKNRKINNKYKNNKKIKFRNFIESGDADDTIFNDTSLLTKSNNKIIANINNKKENIKENNHGFKIEEKKSEDSEIDFNNFKNEIKKNNITNSSIYSQFSKNKSDNEDSEEDSENSDEDSERVQEIDDYEDEKNKRKYKNNNNSKYIKNKNNNIFDSSIIYNVEYKIKESDKFLSEKNHYNINNIEEHKSIYNEKKEDSINEINKENDDYSQINSNIENNIEFNPINNYNNNNLYLKNNDFQKFYTNNNPSNNFFSQQIFNNINNNIYKNNFICQKYDMNFLEETYNHATILSLKKGNISIDSNCQKIDNGLPLKDSYMFKFEISQLNPNFNEKLKIDVGFKIKYTNPSDINFIEDENSINIHNMKYKIGSLYDYIKINKRLIIFKNMGPIYALINISKGKFFIIGKKELEKRKQNIFLDRNNTEIFYIQNFLPISPNNLRSIKPAFNPNKAQIKYFEIKMNEELTNKK